MRALPPWPTRAYVLRTLALYFVAAVAGGTVALLWVAAIALAASGTAIPPAACDSSSSSNAPVVTHDRENGGSE